MQHRAYSVLARSSVLLPAAIAAVLALQAATVLAVDLNGRWRVSTEFLDVTQTGSSVSFTLFGLNFAGTVTADGHLVASASTPACVAGVAGVDLRVVADDYLDGLVGCDFFERFFSQRCQCFDGNSTDGDGCDADCQTEPCFSCTGDPSLCTPLGDGAACQDGSACTFGETCSGGICGGGTTNTNPTCIDVTGRWLVRGTSSFIGTTEVKTDLVQRGSILEFRDPSSGALGAFGTIDPFSGAFEVSTPTGFPICVFTFGTGVADSLSGRASMDGATWIAAGLGHVGTPMFCFEDKGSITATRCGSGTLDAGEQCDDGNAENGDGCSSFCQTETAAPVPDHLKCYAAKDLRNPVFAPSGIDLADEFVVNDGAFEVKKPFLFCTPVSKDGAPISDIDAYVTCYKMTGPKLSSSQRPRIEVGNDLGTSQLEVRKPRYVCLRSTKTALP